MEIDILNDILTKTVSNLFANKIKHNSYLCLDDDDSGLLDLSFPSSTPNLDKDIEQPTQNLIQHQLNQQQQLQLQHGHQKQQQQLQQPKPKQDSICTPELWKSTIGKKKYEEALKRLDLDDKKIKSKAYLNQTLEVLNQEKSKIKNELKKYDNEFFEVFKQMPNRNEKEIMKPLYIYYKTLKGAINQKMANQNNSTAATANQMLSATATETKNVLLDGNPMNKAHTTLTGQGPKYGHSSTYSQNYASMTNNPINPSNTFSTMTTQNHSNPSSNTISYKNVNHKKANSAYQAQNEGELLDNNNNNTIAKKPQEKKRALSKEEVTVLEKEYYHIKKEQNDLKQKLHQYQTDFQTNNNRKVKFVKDITPVKKEYDKYKTNKNRLKDIKDSLTDNDKKDTK